MIDREDMNKDKMLTWWIFCHVKIFISTHWCSNDIEKSNIEEYVIAYLSDQSDALTIHLLNKYDNELIAYFIDELEEQKIYKQAGKEK